MSKLKLLLLWLMLVGFASGYSQEILKCIVIETNSGGKIECYLTKHPKLTQNNDIVKLTTDDAVTEFSTNDFKKVYFGEDKYLYKLTYYVDGESYKSYKYAVGESITPETEPQKTGYSFSGWSDIPSTMPEKDVDVYGMFSVNKYKLTYLVDDVEYKSFQVDYGATIVPEEAPTREGYIFSGWSDIPSTMPDHDVTIRGSFTKGSFTLTYMLDGEMYKTYQLEYGEEIIPEEVPVREGNSFSGWIGLPSTMPANDVVVTGTFTINKYTVSYIIDNEVFQKDELEFGAKIVPPEAPKRDGYDFSWGDYPKTMPAKDIFITGTYTTGINGIHNGLDISSGSNYYTLKGLGVNESVTVYNAAGKTILRYTASEKGELVIRTSQLSIGVNIIKTKNQSFKVIRK